MNKYLIGLQHFAGEQVNQANTVVNFSGNNEVKTGAYGEPIPHGYAGSMNSTFYANASGTGDLSVEMKTFYDKALLTMAEPNLVHEQFAKKKPIPRNGGKTIEFRKFSKLPKALQPITEGVTPKGNKLKVEAFTATVNQYGDYIEQTDLLELTAIDNTIVEATKELASQAGLTLDTVVREELAGATNVQYAKKNNGDGTYTAIESRANLTKACPLTVKDVFRAVAELKSNNAPKIGDSYVAIIHPKTAFTLMQEAGDAWVNAQQYKNPEKIYRGELGMLGGVRFVESSEAKVWAPEDIVAGFNRLTVKTDVSNYDEVVVTDTLPTTTFTNGLKVYVDGVEKTLNSITYGENGSTLTFSANLTVTAGKMICGEGAGKDGSAVFSTIFLGDGAYATTELTGGGLETIVKQKGYGNDPLNQRSSIGWKATKVAKRLLEEYMVRFESTSPELSDTTDSN